MVYKDIREHILTTLVENVEGLSRYAKRGRDMAANSKLDGGVQLAGGAIENAGVMVGTGPKHVRNTMKLTVAYANTSKHEDLDIKISSHSGAIRAVLEDRYGLYDFETTGLENIKVRGPERQDDEQRVLAVYTLDVQYVGAN